MSDTTNEAPESTEADENEELEGQEQPESPEDEERDEPEGDFDRERVLQKIKKLNSENRNERQKRQAAEAQVEKDKGKTERVQALEAANARYETLADNDLPLKLAKFISATEPDKILEQAEELLSLGAAGGKTPPTNQPREANARQRNKPYQSDELGDPDDFAKKIYSN